MLTLMDLLDLLSIILLIFIYDMKENIELIIMEMIKKFRKKKNYRYFSHPNYQAFSEIFSPEFKLETNSPQQEKDKKDT